LKPVFLLKSKINGLLSYTFEFGPSGLYPKPWLQSGNRQACNEIRSDLCNRPEGGYSAYVPDLQEEAIVFHIIEEMRLHGETVPEPSSLAEMLEVAFRCAPGQGALCQ
jgi:hypothetical protein